MRKFAHPSGRAQPHDKGITEAARVLGMPRREIQRGTKIASLTPEAKEAAKAAGIDDNQSKLLRVAAATADKQVDLINHLTAHRDIPKDDGLDIPPMLIRDPGARAMAAHAAIDQAILTIGAREVAEIAVARMTIETRFEFAQELVLDVSSVMGKPKAAS